MDTTNTQIHGHPLSLLGTGILIKVEGLNWFYCAKTSSNYFNANIWSNKINTRQLLIVLNDSHALVLVRILGEGVTVQIRQL